MVGFGKSLRMARRSGWEGGYLDYETLKLLLSQIEAVYEEEAHRANNPFEFGLETRASRRRRSRITAGRDYREDLFLESDSEAAFASLQGDDDQSNLSADEALLADEAAAAPKSFSLSYSHEATSSDDEDEKQVNGCGSNVTSIFASRPWSTKKNEDSNSPRVQTLAKQSSQQQATRMKKRHHMTVDEEEDNFAFVHQEQQTSFFMASDDPDSAVTPKSSGYSQHYQATEKASLLPPATPLPHGSSLYTLSENLTPPASSFRHKKRNHMSHATSGRQTGSIEAPALPSLAKGRLPNAKAMHQKLDEERQRARVRRRENRRKLRKLRDERERKVPTYIRIAHAKARAITERFLGLLRAETEKVLLFAQSRLGELADTAGSLRFPSFEDDHFHGRPKVEIRGTQYDYTLSDGGMHPSASSSSDDEQENGGFGFAGMYPWSDSDDDRDNEQRIGSSIALSRTDETATQSLMASFRTPRFGGSKKTTATTATNMVRRKISHFRDIRKNRPVFQRNDHILGEDMLFLSAVEEADGYTAVATELLHVLRFICVNLIAVRKICRKHDRLLMNRMLGGYYHRTRSFESGHMGDSRTLGGLLAQASNDIYEAHPALIGQRNHFKLVGIYDTKIQKLANSRTVQVISSCLALALSEYEVARSRADALTKLNSSSSRTPQQSQRSWGRSAEDSDDHGRFGLDSDGDSDGPPSTESTMSLTRLRFAVSSVFSLREAARYKYNQYEAYLSRSAFAYCGRQVAGEGLDGCSRRTLDFVVSYDPDAVLLHEPNVLFEGLQEGRWKSVGLNTVMTSTLATATIAESSAFTRNPQIPFSKEEYKVTNAVSVRPGNKANLKGLSWLMSEIAVEKGSSMVAPIASTALQLNCVSCFLFALTYFSAHPTSITLAKYAEIAPANSALLISVTNVSAILASVAQCWFISRAISSSQFSSGSARTLKIFFAFAAIMGCLGHGVHAMSIRRNSIPLEVLGRFIVGFSFAEIVNRHMLGVCFPSLVVTETARLMKYKNAGMVCGLILGTVAQLFCRRSAGTDVKGVQLLSWVLSLLWFLFLVQVCCRFEASPGGKLFHPDRILQVETIPSDASISDAESNASPSVLQQSSSDESSHDESNPLKAAYGSKESSRADLKAGEQEPLLQSEQDSSVRVDFARQMRSTTSKIRSLIASHHAIPVTLMLIAFSTYSWEMILSATPIIVSRYFAWTATHAGLYLSGMALLIMPTHYVASQVAYRFEERIILKRSLYVIGAGFFGMINWFSIYSLAGRMPLLFTEMEGREAPRYDGPLGIFQYLIGTTVVYGGLVALNGSSFSLLSKVSRYRRKDVMVNAGTLVTFVTLVSRIVADCQIVLVDLSDKLINIDLVNSLTMPSILLCMCALYLAKKNYFYMISKSLVGSESAATLTEMSTPPTSAASTALRNHLFAFWL